MWLLSRSRLFSCLCSSSARSLPAQQAARSRAETLSQYTGIFMTKIINLTCEYRTNPLGIDVTQPRFAWQMETDRQGARQTAYRVLAASTADGLSKGAADLWDSGKIDSDQSVQIPYEG